MAIELSTPDVARLSDVVDALRDWQREASPMQLHPGDLGWYRQFGAEAMAAAVRTWSRGGQVLAIGFLDGPDVLRMTVAPQVWREEELARRVVADLSEPRRGVLPAGKASVAGPHPSARFVVRCRLEPGRALDAASPRPFGAGRTTGTVKVGHRFLGF